MAVEDSPPPPFNNKIIPFTISNKVPIKLDLEKHNYNSWSSFSLIHLGSLGLKSHVEKETASTNLEWCQLDDLIKMWILGSLCDSLQEQVVTTPGNAKALWGHLKNLFHDNKDAKAINLDNELISNGVNLMISSRCGSLDPYVILFKNKSLPHRVMQKHFGVISKIYFMITRTLRPSTLTMNSVPSRLER
ncbi:hypothetical protein Tco_1140520 [Tanacetum coccineum]